jgi:hypothetical protein
MAPLALTDLLRSIVGAIFYHPPGDAANSPEETNIDMWGFLQSGIATSVAVIGGRTPTPPRPGLLG